MNLEIERAIHQASPANQQGLTHVHDGNQSPVKYSEVID